MSPASGVPTLELRKYRLRRYATELVVDADFPPGVNVLLGENGVGKTTLLRSLVRPRLRARHSLVGVTLDGITANLSGQRVCMLPQSPTLPQHLTVREVLRYCCHVRGVAPDQVTAMLDRAGLLHVENRRVGRLSGGESQRVNLALAFVGRPDVTLLDEPSVALDPIARTRFAESLTDLTSDHTIVVMSTHVASDISIADRVFLMSRNRICWTGTPEDFLSNAPDGAFDTAFARLLTNAAR